MTQPVRYSVRLEGCTSTPLANYLKALGVFRIIAEQADPGATAWWEGDVFCLCSSFSEETLTAFLATEYRPSALVAPWGARSGFYAADSEKSTDSEKSAREAIEKIVSSNDPRLAEFKECVRQIKEAMARHSIEVKPSNDDKTDFCKILRNELSDEVVPWLDTCYVLTNESKAYPPLLGSGGNEGSGSFVSGFAQQIVTVFIEGLYPKALSHALHGGVAVGVMDIQTPGHFSPDATKGVNATSGYSGDNSLNPWDYLLLMEGTVLWAAAVSKSQALGVRASFPFTFQPRGVGHASMAFSDGSKPTQAKRDIYEVWLPLWSSPTTLDELQVLISEGRVSTGRRTAENAVDAVQGLLSLGTDKGIGSFQRCGFLMRNGQSFLGVDLGSIKVAKAEHPHAALISEERLERWIRRLRRLCEKDTTSLSMTTAFVSLERAIFGMTRCDSMTNVLVALGRLEHAIVKSPATASDKKQPLSPLPLLSSDWVSASDDGTPEFRLACALASIRGSGRVGPLRSNMIPCDPEKPWMPYDLGQMNKPHVVWRHGNLVDNLIDVLRRRCMDAERYGLTPLPLSGNCAASIHDVLAFVRGDVDEKHIENLLWGLNAIDWRTEYRTPIQGSETTFDSTPPVYALLKLTHGTVRPDGTSIGPNAPGIPYDPAILAQAAAGRIDATRTAARRLRASGWKPLIEVAAGAPEHIRRCAAAVLFPIDRGGLRRIARTVLRFPASHQAVSRTEALSMDK